ncbi:MAG: hypothetical protein KDD61_04020 [Bdellovibrionales bacterium]|nr:hypothetical protein [Bdellovibrionales bacterium]
MDLTVRQNPDKTRTLYITELKDGVKQLEQELSYELFHYYCDDIGGFNFGAFITIGFANVATWGGAGLAFMGYLSSLDEEEKKKFSTFMFGKREVSYTLRHIELADYEAKRDKLSKPYYLDEWGETYDRLKLSIWATLNDYHSSRFEDEYEVQVSKCSSSPLDIDSFSCNDGQINVFPKKN